jgi:predicted transcriptional regulator
MHRTTIYLPDDLHRRLRLLAYATNSGISDLLRAAAERPLCCGRSYVASTLKGV